MANSNGWGDGAANNSIGWGQGANNNIGWGDSHAKSWAGLTDIVGASTDADAQAFITAAAITDPTQQTAINNLVVGMKADGIWTKMKAIYPFVGGTATTHKWNLKDPRDLDAAFRLVFNGGWTHSSTGATPNGTNGYADTKLVPSSVLGQNSTHFSNYFPNFAAEAACQIGVLSVGNVGALYAFYRLSSTVGAYIRANQSTDTFANSSQIDNSGLRIVSRTASDLTKVYVNNTNNYSSTQVSTDLSVNAISISALNSANTRNNFSALQQSFCSIGDGLTDTEAANLYTRVQAFQTSLSRQV